jgi:RNA 2',3'-cyclic 3'-phosphodiesterase
VRLFFAVWPPAETAAALQAWAGGLEGRRVAQENIHLTLAFLGEADPQRAIAAAKRVRGARHDLPLDEARFWPHNQIVWAGPRATPPPLAALVESLKLELYRDQFILERRPFAAHVTLLRKAKAPKALPALPALSWPVEELLLVRSRTSPKGPVYEPVERFPLSE